MTAIMEGQGCLFDPVTASGKTCPEPSVPTAGKTSKPSSRSLSKSATRQLPMCLCLKKADGRTPGSSTTRWEGGLWPGVSTTLNTGEFRSDADGFLSLPISTGSQRRRFYLTLNCGEKPRIPNPTKLSEILEENADPKYRLSARACQGILNRAERREKELPPELEAALVAQSRQHTGQNGTETQELTAEETLPSNQLMKQSAADSSTRQALQQVGVGYEEEKAPSLMAGQERAVCYGICSYESNAMKSSNPRSGVYEADTARTLDLNGGNPACNQGWVAVVTAVDCRNGT